MAPRAPVPLGTVPGTGTVARASAMATPGVYRRDDPYLRQQAANYFGAPTGGLVNIAAQPLAHQQITAFGQNFMQTALAGRQAQMMRDERMAERDAAMQRQQQEQYMLNNAVQMYTANPTPENFAQLAAMSPQVAGAVEREPPDYAKQLEQEAARRYIAGDPSLYQQIAAARRPTTTIDLGGETSLAKAQTAELLDAMETGTSARSELRIFDAIQELIEGEETGAIPTLTRGTMSVLGQMGFGDELMDPAARMASAQQLADQAAMAYLKRMGPKPTDADLKFAQQMVGDINSPYYRQGADARRKILQGDIRRGEAAERLYGAGDLSPSAFVAWRGGDYTPPLRDNPRQESVGVQEVRVGTPAGTETETTEAVAGPGSAYAATETTGEFDPAAASRAYAQDPDYLETLTDEQQDALLDYELQATERMIEQVQKRAREVTGGPGGYLNLD